MAYFQVTNSASGKNLGIYEADTPEAAIRAMLADAGCDDEPSEDLIAIEITAGVAVEAGTGDDFDYGTVVEVSDHMAIVAWHGSETCTPCPVVDLRVR